MPVAPVTWAGMVKVSSGSSTATLGMSPGPWMSIFTLRSTSVMTVKRVISEPVPAVVGTAMMGIPSAVGAVNS